MNAADLFAFAKVAAVDVVLAGDNAIAVGALAATLPGPLRRRALVIGVLGALVLRIGFALGVAQLLAYPGVALVGGLMLVWIGIKLLRGEDGDEGGAQRPSSFMQAVLGIIVADITLSLDNVLGVAGAAGGHQMAIAFGLVLSVILMGLAAAAIAQLIQRYRWIIWVGFVLIEIIAVKMIVEGVPPVLEFIR